MEMEWITPQNSGRPGTLPAAQALHMDGARLPVMQWPKSLVHLNHLLNPLPGMVLRLQLQLSAVHPVHEQYSTRWMEWSGLTNARSSSLGPPQENCHLQ